MDTSSRGRWFAFPRILWLSLVAALVLTLPTAWIGFVSDDYVHLLILEGFPAPGTPWDLFRFAGGNPTELQRLMDEGPYPWWTLPELKLSFWRPLSSALAVMDHRLFGRNAVGWHLHSLAWYLGMVALYGALLRRFLPGAIGALALFLFAIDGAHFMVAGWIANRNALVAAVPALFGLWMHLEWREHHRPWALPLSLAGLAVGLLGGETALGLFAYVLAYELLGGRSGVKERLRSIAPAALLGLVYLVAYKLRGYGAYGSGSYMDPVGEPGRFLVGALARIPVLLGGLLLEVPADIWVAGEPVRPPLVVIGLFGLGLLVLLVRAAWPFLSEDERRHCRWLFLGAALSLLPVAATFPSNRLLLVPGLGGSVAVALVLVHAWRSRARGWRPRGVAAGAAVLALMHLVLAPLLWPLMTLAFWQGRVQLEPVAQTLERELDYQRLPQQRLVVLPMPVAMTSMYIPMVMATRGMPKPLAWWQLSLSPEPHVLTRTGPDSIELTLTRNQFLTSEFEGVFRGVSSHPLRQGAQVKLKGLTVTVLETNDKGPTRLGFTFDRPLEDPSFVFLRWKDDALRPFTPPPVGERVAL
ncbi:hypothetical protein [Archangium lansingense]|uniref:Glycosyltransferase RgtA/B/C/D-like domain-containing protein n=1 Tax=Archangium lansingense TaxID=2995310 RepID=A0ABT3ZUE6_9BACT|nr:hypothetical protein [Archangium lansinium]MCY1073037.1 hypothetical protein [Archangium lansinium]